MLASELRDISGGLPSIADVEKKVLVAMSAVPAKPAGLRRWCEAEEQRRADEMEARRHEDLLERRRVGRRLARARRYRRQRDK
eukprot:1311050-Alexandrium_andersonii.AAC.1